MKLLVIACDGMDYETVRSKGILEELRDNENHGLLESIPAKNNVPHTGPAFASIYTGVEPEVHGITSGGWRLEHADWQDIQTQTVFDIIEQHYSLGLMTMPITYPARELNGWMVSGFPAPIALTATDDWSYNVDKKLLTNFIIDFNQVKKATEFTPELAYKIDKRKLDVANESDNVDVLFICYTMLDRAGHFGTPEQYNKSYELIDDLVAETVIMLDPDDLIICSDHGFDFDNKQHNLDGFWLSTIDAGKEPELKITDIVKLVSKGLGLENKEMMTQLKELGYV